MAIDKEIAAVIDRPMTAPSGHLGEWVVTGIFHVGRAQPAVAVATEPRRSSDRALIRTERPAFGQEASMPSDFRMVRRAWCKDDGRSASSRSTRDLSGKS